MTRLPTTTEVEKTPCALVMTGRPAARSAEPAAALTATSAAPDAAPSSASPADRLSGPVAVTATAAPTTPSRTSRTAVTRCPHRSRARPAAGIAGSAPAPTNSSAVPSCPSVRPAWSRIAGTDAPHTPQKAPKAANPQYAVLDRTPAG
ncbi:hypothetical protein GCM10023075_74270 [Streptosporangium album]